MTKKQLNDLTYEIIGCAIEVHKEMGRGLTEKVYHECMKHELASRNINYQTEMKIPVIYKEKEMDIHFRCDLFIENSIVIELKSIQDLNAISEAQLLTYMKLLKAPKGILINFNCCNIFKDGQKTYINEFFTDLPQF